MSFSTGAEKEALKFTPAGVPGAGWPLRTTVRSGPACAMAVARMKMIEVAARIIGFNVFSSGYVA